MLIFFFSFELTDYPDKTSFFKFRPCLKLHHQRNNIIYDHDIMVLQSSDSTFIRPINLAVVLTSDVTLGKGFFINSKKISLNIF